MRGTWRRWEPWPANDVLPPGEVSKTRMCLFPKPHSLTTNSIKVWGYSYLPDFTQLIHFQSAHRLFGGLLPDVAGLASLRREWAASALVIRRWSRESTRPTSTLIGLGSTLIEFRAANHIADSHQGGFRWVGPS